MVTEQDVDNARRPKDKEAGEERRREITSDSEAVYLLVVTPAPVDSPTFTTGITTSS